MTNIDNLIFTLNLQAKHVPDHIQPLLLEAAKTLQHLHSNFENMKLRNQLLRQRPDLPLDRTVIGEQLLTRIADLEAQLQKKPASLDTGYQ